MSWLLLLSPIKWVDLSSRAQHPWISTLLKCNILALELWLQLAISLDWKRSKPGNRCISSLAHMHQGKCTVLPKSPNLHKSSGFPAAEVDISWALPTHQPGTWDLPVIKYFISSHTHITVYIIIYIYYSIVYYSILHVSSMYLHHLHPFQDFPWHPTVLLSLSCRLLWRPQAMWQLWWLEVTTKGGYFLGHASTTSTSEDLKLATWIQWIFVIGKHGKTEKYGGEYGEIWGAGRWGLETAQFSFSDLWVESSKTHLGSVEAWKLRTNNCHGLAWNINHPDTKLSARNDPKKPKTSNDWLRLRCKTPRLCDGWRRQEKRLAP